MVEVDRLNPAIWISGILFNELLEAPGEMACFIKTGTKLWGISFGIGNQRTMKKQKEGLRFATGSLAQGTLLKQVIAINGVELLIVPEATENLDLPELLSFAGVGQTGADQTTGEAAVDGRHGDDNLSVTGACLFHDMLHIRGRSRKSGMDLEVEERCCGRVIELALQGGCLVAGDAVLWRCLRIGCCPQLFFE